MKKNAKFIAVILFFVSFHAFGDGALAIDKNHGENYGWAVNFSTTSEAQSRALDQCGFGCYIVVTFSGGCAAYAADQGLRKYDIRLCLWVSYSYRCGIRRAE